MLRFAIFNKPFELILKYFITMASVNFLNSLILGCRVKNCFFFFLVLKLTSGDFAEKMPWISLIEVATKLSKLPI